MKLKVVPSQIKGGCNGCVFDSPNWGCYEMEQNIKGREYDCEPDGIIYVEDKETVEVKQLTIDELREQFEESHIKAYGFSKSIVYDGEDYYLVGHDKNLSMVLDEIKARWLAYKSCAKTNRILKENN